jgi:hypothetical protein
VSGGNVSDVDGLLSQHRRVTRVWQNFYVDREGNPQIVDLQGADVYDAPWPVVAPAKPIIAKPRPVTAKRTDTTTIVIAPDPQIGCRRYEDGSLDWFCDDRAIDVSLQIIRAAKPDRIVNLGDTCDFPEWSQKFLVSPEYVLTTQPTIDRTHRYLAEQITEAPAGCAVDLLEGNHDARLASNITKNAMAALRLRQANAPESWPVLSLQSLLRLADFGTLADGSPVVTYRDGYPAGRVKLADGCGPLSPLYAIHGERLTVAAVAKNERQSFVQGHIHRRQDHWETFEVDGVPVEVNAWSPGCLAKIDGTIPSTRGGSDAKGRPVRRFENWQQGVGIVTVLPDGSWSKEIVAITDGVAVWRDQRFAA